MNVWCNKNYWNELASEIKEDKQLGRALPDDAPEFIVKWVRNIEKDISHYCLQDHSGRLFDAGCGNANFLLHSFNSFPEKELVYVGLDFSKNMLERGTDQTKNSPQPLFVQGNISRLPIKESMFDRIVCSGVLTCLGSIKELEETLCEFYRVLKPKGILVFDIFNKLLPKTIAKSMLRYRVLPRAPKYMSPLWIKKKLKLTQFDIVSYRGYDFRPTAGYMTYRGMFRLFNPGYIQEKFSTMIERNVASRIPLFNLFGSRIYLKCMARK